LFRKVKYRMAQIANVAYFFYYCNKVLGTSYNMFNTNISKQAINLYWTTKAVQKIYNDIHQPKSGCRLHLSTRFNLYENAGLVAVDTTFVHSVVGYLSNLNKICDTDCDCPCVKNTTITETCNTCSTCKTCYTCSACSTCANCNTCRTCGNCIA
jgi:hypothetical protein